MNNLVAKFLSVDGIQRVLEKLSKKPIFFKILNLLSKPNSVYDTFANADAASRLIRPISHLNKEMIKSNFTYGRNPRPSDYPALFWLTRIAIDIPLRVFDFGGGAGQLFYQYREMLKPGSIEQWIVHDLPEVVEYGKQQTINIQVPELNFSTKLDDCASCNVFLTAGSLHYWASSLEDLQNAVCVFPEHFIVNRSPFRERGESFITIQVGRSWAVPCVVRNFQELGHDLSRIGYNLIDSWIVEAKTLNYPLLPHYKSPYRGAYFHKGKSLG